MSATLTPFDHQVAVLAVSGMRQRAVAQRLNVHYNTVWRALHKPAVQELVEALLGRTEEESAKRFAEDLARRHQEAIEARQREREARRERRRKHSMAVPRQGQGTPLPSEPSYDPYWPIRQALAQAQQGQHRAEAPPRTQEPAPEPPSPGAAMPREQEPDPAMADAQARDWRARLEELKRWPV